MTSARVGTADDADVSARSSKPHLASALEAAIRWTAGHVLLRRSSSLSVEIESASNRALLQGKMSRVSVSARDCVSRFNLLSFARLESSAENLRLGYVPFVVPCLPWIAWRLRRYVWLAIVATQVMHVTGHLKSGSVRRMLRTNKERMTHALAARPSTINYSLSVAEGDVARSVLLRFWLQSILRSLVENSVVGAAAVVGDELERWRDQGRSEGTDPQNALVLAPPKGSDGEGQRQQQGLTSDLLSATAFRLKDVSFGKGKVVLQAEGLMPGGARRPLPFTIRADVEPASLPDGGGTPPPRRGDHNAIAFARPECRMNTGPLTAGSLLGKLVPGVVWLPFGAGVAVPCGEGGRIHRADVADGRGGKDAGRCRVDGSFDVFPRRRDRDGGGTLAAR